MKVLKGQAVNKNMMRVLEGRAAKAAERHSIVEAACNGEIGGELCRACVELNNGRVGRGSLSVGM